MKNINRQLVNACINDDLEKVQECLENGAEVNKRDTFKITAGNTPLLWAVRKSRIRIVELLIKSGADLEMKNNFGKTALFEASECNEYQKIDILCKYGADANTADNAGCTPLALAARRGFANTVKALLKNGAHVNAINSIHAPSTALDNALYCNRKECIAVLLENGAKRKDEKDYRQMVASWVNG